MSVAVLKADSEAARELHRLADGYVPRFAETFTASALAARGDITDAVVEADLARGMGGQPTGLYALVDAMQIAKADESELAVYREMLVDAALLEGVVLDLQSPFVHEAAKKMTANLVTGVKAETKQAIRQIIFEGIRDGEAPVKMSRTIREVVGLTRRDAIAVKRYAERATDAGLRRYSTKLLNARAQNIARTETIRASARGQMLAWEEMASNNLIDTSRFRMRWMVTNDDRLCSTCAPMDGQKVALGSEFVSSERGVLASERVPYAGGTHESPPLHPRCRCVLVGSF